MPVTSTDVIAGAAFAEPERDTRAFGHALKEIDTMRRRELWRLAESLGIPYPPGATANQMRDILRAMPHVLTALEQSASAVQSTQDPVVTRRPLAESVLDIMENAKRAQAAEIVPEPAPHVEPQTEAGQPAPNQDNMALNTMTVFQLRKVARERGLGDNKDAKKAELLQKLGVPTE